jgi:hypothetical protein
MCTVHRNRTLTRLYIRNVFCAQKQITFQTVHQKCVLCTETEHFPGCTLGICSVHRSRKLSRRYNRNVYCAHKQNNFQTVHQKYVLCTQKENFQTVHQKCVLCTETVLFPDGTSEMCIVHRNRTLSRQYT